MCIELWDVETSTDDRKQDHKWRWVFQCYAFLKRNIPGTHFCLRLSRFQDHCVSESIRSTEKSIDLIRNRTRDLQACSIVPHPTMQLCTSVVMEVKYKLIIFATKVEFPEARCWVPGAQAAARWSPIRPNIESTVLTLVLLKVTWSSRADGLESERRLKRNLYAEEKC
jgi:hypothetical protein